jgi:hypothetical protein
MYEFDVPEEEHIALPQRPELLFSLAVGLLGDAAAAIATSNDERAHGREPVDSNILGFSATYFDAYLQSRLGEFAEAEFPTLAAASYYLAHNPGSAKVLISQAPSPPPYLGAGLPLVTHRLLSGNYTPIEGAVYTQAANRLLSQTASYLEGEGTTEGLIAVTQDIRRDAYDTGDGRELLYADVVSAIVHRKVENAARTILPAASEIGLELWHSALRRPSFPRELWPSQQRICAAGILRGRSCLIQMPTSAGKTRATELVLRAAFLSGRASLAVIVCPFRSLCHDIRGDMARAFAGENVRLNEASDSFQVDLEIDDLWAANTVLIVTPEKLLYLLRRSPELARHIGLVVYDEGHQFDSGARGVTYELLLTSLKLLLAEQTQVILISAVIANAANVASWLLGDAGAVVDGAGLLPTRRSIAFTSWRDRLGRLEYVSPLDPDDTEFFVPRVLDRVTLNPAPRERVERQFPTPEDGTSVGLYLGLKLVTNGSVAIFCGRKDTAIRLCAAAAGLFERTEAFEPPAASSSREEVARLTSLFGMHFGDDAPTTKAAALGVFPHHASVPNGARLAIEFAMKESLIRLVVCTSTLAQGVNLPIRYLIVTGVYQGGDRILVRDFHNLIGRAGRAGMHTEGSIIFADTKVFDRKRDRRERWRWETAKELLDPANSEPSASSISSIFEPFRFGNPPLEISLDIALLHNLLFDDEAVVEATVQQVAEANPALDAKRFRRFVQDQAHIVHGIAAFLLAHLDFESDGLADRAVDLARNTLAHHLADDTQRGDIELLFRNIAERVLEGAATDDARTALRRSPLSPTSVRLLKAWLEGNRATLIQALRDGVLLSRVIPVILEHNRNSAIAALSIPSVMPDVVEEWMRGSPFSAIFDLMRERGIRLGGNRRRPLVEDAVALCEGALGYEAAMIVATLADLAEGQDDLSQALSSLQRRMKAGLPSEAACGFFEAGFADRVVAQSLAATFPNAGDRHSARAIVREAPARARSVLNEFPAYFMSILDELLV